MLMPFLDLIFKGDNGTGSLVEVTTNPVIKR